MSLQATKNILKKQKNILTYLKSFGILHMHIKKVQNDLWKLSKTSITLSQEKINQTFLESLILAQDERWRHA